MTFTRRRWDAWSLVMALALAVGACVEGRWTPLVGVVPFWLMRFRIPAQGFPDTPVSKLSPGRRRLIGWCVVSLPAALVAAIFAPRVEAWWIYPIMAGAHMAVTLRLARRVDLERAASRV